MSIEQELKLCNYCSEFKPLDQFHRNNRSVDGHQNYCKACMKVYGRRQREKVERELYVLLASSAREASENNSPKVTFKVKALKIYLPVSIDASKIDMKVVYKAIYDAVGLSVPMCPHGHLLTPSNIYTNRDGSHPTCKICKYDRAKKWRRNSKERKIILRRLMGENV